MAPVWLRRPRDFSQSQRLESKFPPHWKELCGADFRWYAGNDKAAVVWNKTDPLVKRAEAHAWDWCEQTFRESIDPVPRREELLSDASKAASWLLQCISRDSSAMWEGLPERDPELLMHLSRTLFPKTNLAEGWRRIFWVEEPGRYRLRVISPGHWKAVTKDLGQYLPTPSPDWRIIRPKRTRGAR
jgi:hypothetical protein